MGAGLKFNFAGFLHVLQHDKTYIQGGMPYVIQYTCEDHVSGAHTPTYYVDIEVKTEAPFHTPRPVHIWIRRDSYDFKFSISPKVTLFDSKILFDINLGYFIVEKKVKPLSEIDAQRVHEIIYYHDYFKNVNAI